MRIRTRSWKRIGLAVGLALSLVGYTAACDSSSTGPGGGGYGNGNGNENVTVIDLTSDLTFSPDSVVIAPGATVRWVNVSSQFHTVTPDGHSEWSHHDMPPNETFEHTFDTEGTFPYYCEPHRSQGMTGTIIVRTGG